MAMYHGQQAGSSLPAPDNASRSPSDSIDLSPIEAMARPMEMDQFNKSRLSSDPMASGRGLNNPVPYGLMSFYASDDSPWVGFNIPASASAQPNHHMNPADVRRNAPAFASWRSNGQPSECGTIPQAYLPSDSGYESRAKQSIDDRSVYEENTETQSLTGGMLNLDPFQFSAPTYRDPHVQPWLPAPPVPVQTSPADKLICPDCQAHCKTKSELNKHHQRHRKAFKCEVQGCSRKEGFGTMNDLDRHKSSVHPELHTAGPRYRCNLNQCQEKEKIWPRADNFRQHLKRVHNQTVSADDDLNQFIWHPSQKSQETSRTVQEDLEGVGVGSELFNLGSVSQEWGFSSPEQPMEMDLLVDPSLTNMDENSNIPLVQNNHAFVQPGQISRPPATIKPLLPGGRTRDIQAQITVNFPKSLDTCSDDLKDSPRDSVIAMDCDLPPKASESESGNESASSQQPTAPAWSSLGENLDEQVALKLLEKLPKELIAKFLKGQSDQKPSQEPTGSVVESHPCTKPGCTKTFNRKCELKKHMKRHEKPYGCTFSGCMKKFGSKNDWKRHENSQHFQLEVWKCSEKRTDDDNTQTGTVCGKVCHRRETFRSHLQKEHKMEDASQVEKAVDGCRVGRNGESRFWCGFCEKIIDITKKSANAWAERFNHIDNHLAGRDNVPKKVISEWKDVDPELEMDFGGSVDDSSDAESCDEVTASHKPSGPVMKSTMARKRSAEDDNDEREPKRLRDARITRRWNCCDCRQDYNVKTTPQCIQCSHQRCTDCEEQEVLVR